jgi:L-fucose isomerase-like protein
MIKPRIGIIGMAFPDNNLGEEMCAAKTNEMVQALKRNNEIEIIPAEDIVIYEDDIEATTVKMAQKSVDIILVVLCTFVPDYYLVKMLDVCDKPVFLWAIEREMKCISLVGACLISGALYNLNKKYEVRAGDITDEFAMKRLLIFARAGMLLRICRTSSIGVSGGKNNIMLSMQWDEFALKRLFGINIINIPIEELYEIASGFSDLEVSEGWDNIISECGEISVKLEDGLYSARLYLAAREIVKRKKLAGYSINCFPALKSKICLAVSLLNNELYAAGCEGDLNSTLMMLLLESLANRPAFNGDFLRLYHDSNSILFSHCGAGAFSLAEDRTKVCLNASIETCDGCAVCYATYARGNYTLLNMMTGENGLRISVMNGEALETDLEYEGTPLRIGFKKSINEILENVCYHGSGHHWSGVVGDFSEEIELICRWMKIQFNRVS